GTSMGSVIGGLYASGMGGAQLERMALSMDWERLFSDKTDRQDQFFTQKKNEGNALFEFRFRNGRIDIPTALISGQLLINFLLQQTLFADVRAGFDFDSLPRRYRAVATDLVSGRSVVLRQGCLAEAMRASLAVPFVFTPFEINDRKLIDGGFRNILPVDVATQMGADLVLAVDIRPRLYTEKELKNPLTFIDQVVAICLLNQEGRSVRDSALVMTPVLGDHFSLDFRGIEALIRAGEKVATDCLPAIRQRLALLSPTDPSLGQDTMIVQGIKINHLKNVPYDDVFARFGIHPEDRVTAALLRQNACRILAAGSFDSVWVEVRSTAMGVLVELNVHERPPLESVEIAGNTVFSKEEIRDAFALKPGMPMNPVAADNGVDAIQAMYHDRGFTLCSATWKKKGGALRLTLREGRIDTLLVKGNTETNEMVILREIGLRKGTLFTTRQMVADIRSLYATGLFVQVYVTLEETDPTGRLQLIIHVREKAYESIMLGLRYDTIRMLEGFLRFGTHNLAHRGYAMNGTVQYGLTREKYLLTLRTDRILYTFLSSEGNLYYYRDRKYVVDPLDSTHFTYNTLRKLGGLFSVAHQILKIGKLSWVFLLEHYQSSRENGDLGDILNYQGLRVFSLRAEFDTYDSPYFPKKGFKLYSSGDLGLDIIGNHDSFFDFTLTYSGAWTPFKGQSFLPAVFVSLADVSLPEPEKNYLGGPTELRMNDDVVLFNSFPLFGYPEQSFTGEYLLTLSLSYRTDLPGPFFLYFHGNLGNAWRNDAFYWKDFPGNFLDESYKGAGVTLAADVPKFGPIRLTASKPLMLKEAEEKKKFSETYYFSMGYDF
ncbi:MAG: hypothetical protein A2293_14585, partial [Elusimicrobia bacterium RIFOXYB2_FULL_49_7]